MPFPPKSFEEIQKDNMEKEERERQTLLEDRPKTDGGRLSAELLTPRPEFEWGED